MKKTRTDSAIHFDPVSRRTFLKGAGGILFSVPFLPSLVADAFAQDATNVKRLVCVFINSGSGAPVWFPDPANTNYTSNGASYKAARISDLITRNGTVSPIFNDPRIARYAQHLNLYRGLDASRYSGHNKTVPFTGHSVGDRREDALPSYPSIDFLASRARSVYSAEPQSRHVTLGVGHSPNNWNGPTVSFSETSTGAIAQIPPILNPIAAYDYFFRNLALPGDEAALARTKARRKSVLDSVLQNYNRLMSNGRLAASERQKLEAHVDGFRSLERKIDAVRISACSLLPTRPTTSLFRSRPEHVLEGQFRVSTDLPLVMDLMAEIAATALRCQLTQVVTIMLDATNLAFTYMGLDAGHGLSHLRVSGEEAKRIQAHQETQRMQSLMISKVMNLVEMLDLDDPLSPGTNMLENTLIVGSNEMGTEGNHREWSMPAFTIGGGKRINSGWYIDYRTRNQISPNYVDSDLGTLLAPVYHGRDYNSFLIGAMQAMGLTPADWERGGVPGFGSYQFPKGDLWYKETESSTKGIITPGRRSAPPFMLKPG